jgi:F-type H+-transporting ATPase subunit b
MKRGTRTIGKKVVKTFAFALLIAPAVAVAAEHGHTDAAHAHGIETLFWPVVNFALYIVGIYFLVRKPLAEALTKRHAMVQEGVATGVTRKRAAEAALHDAQIRMSKVEGEIAELKRRIAEETKRESEALIVSAQEKAERIQTAGKEAAIAEQKTVEANLRQELSAAVLRIAEERLRGKLTPESDRGFRERVVSNIGNLLN